MFPLAAVAVCRAAQVGDAAGARRLNERLEPMWRLFRELTGLRLTYAAANLLGLTQAQPPRPILPLSEADRRRVTVAIAEAGLA